jgi:beta-N-acetylhexosaminidase
MTVIGLRQKIGQMFLVGCQGESLSRDERLLIEEYSFGGFILFQANCCAPRQILSLCRELWDSAADAPPFIAIDQEGGRVHRLPQPFSHFPSAGRLGATRNPELAYKAGKATALELALAGVNLNFAPVLDVESNPRNPVIGDRAFGSEPNQVTAMSAAWTRGLRDGGIIPCGKHFPGHGDTDKDSHFDLPVVNKALDKLKAVELRPFVDACKNGIEALMTAHGMFPALDASFPATLSERIVTGLLRHQLGYNGVVFSDDMQMKAISAHYPPEDAAVLAAVAGVDVLLFCHELPRAIAAFESLCDQAAKDPALRARVETSTRRIGELKRRYLKMFSGAADNELESKLKRLDHQRIVEELHGSL